MAKRRYRTFHAGEIVATPTNFAEVVGYSYEVVYVRYAFGSYDTFTSDQLERADMKGRLLFAAQRDIRKYLDDFRNEAHEDKPGSMQSEVARLLNAPTVDVAADR